MYRIKASCSMNTNDAHWSNYQSTNTYKTSFAGQMALNRIIRSMCIGASIKKKNKISIAVLCIAQNTDHDKRYALYIVCPNLPGFT